MSDELEGVAGYMQRAKQQALQNVEHVAEGVAADTLSEGKLFEIAQSIGDKRLEELNERQAKVVTYRFFGGLTQKEIAEVLNVSEPTVRRDWRLARAWLSREMRTSSEADTEKDAPE